MKYLIRFKESIWIIPVLHGVASFLLALAIVYFNFYVLPNIPIKLPFFMHTSMDLARTILGSIAGALLTMTTITFSTIMVVLTTYSSQYSPRVLKDFVNDPKTMHVLGIFIGGFLYSILSLAFLQESSFEGEVISAIVGVMLAIACLLVFVYFIQHVASSIQITNLIRSLDKDIVYEIQREERAFERDEISVLHEKPMTRVYLNSYDVTVKDYGYIQYINYQSVLRWAEENDALVEAVVKMGTFMSQGAPIFKVQSNKKIENFDALNSTYIIGKERMISYDPDYALQKLVDVTMRALSASTYDPFTVKQCLDYLSVAIRKRVKETGHLVVYRKEEVYVIAKRTPLRKLLYDVFGQVHYYAREETVVYMTLLQCYYRIAVDGNDYVKEEIKVLTTHLNETFNQEILKPLDVEYVNAEKEKLMAIL